jgi:hypothetical protein
MPYPLNALSMPAAIAFAIEFQYCRSSHNASPSVSASSGAPGRQRLARTSNCR